MARLTRAEAQERNRARILAAAGVEFAERGFRDAKVDTIAERAGLTRGAVYSNFPGKRALYFAVLADLAAQAPPMPAVSPEPRTAPDALTALADVWLSRLALAPQDGLSVRIGMDLMPQIVAEEGTRQSFGQIMKVNALLLGLGLENLAGGPGRAGRLVRKAEVVLTTLEGAGLLATIAPGFVRPGDMLRSIEAIADLDLDEPWTPPETSAAVQPADRPWMPPPGVEDAMGLWGPGVLEGDGVVVFLGLRRLAAVEDAVRAAPPGVPVSLVVVAEAPEEVTPLVRLALAGLGGLLRHVVPRDGWPALRVVCDEDGAVAAAVGLGRAGDETESAVRVEGGRIRAHADGPGAGHAIAAGVRG
ncbi:TetR/AcrR family transcriptional regulator [Allostreptomyces psammosilenae]|uniref:AcrR family transcriptional regulator n=1 Tax=Allostreptomyces psammosilenae TaxID=1892865 RepID=A0A853AB28_9ACTN|nr:TetR/AcrR family transcriptional regulator [Allostreptomyces psammosilenae]NYI07708.1 AcrR family transcriptional regulator [Allostreptomyces psammosilenae]